MLESKVYLTLKRKGKRVRHVGKCAHVNVCSTRYEHILSIYYVHKMNFHFRNLNATYIYERKLELGLNSETYSNSNLGPLGQFVFLLPLNFQQFKFS